MQDPEVPIPIRPSLNPTPASYDCAVCKVPFAQLRQADHHAFSPPRPNDILICSNCGNVNTIAPVTRAVVSMTEEEISSLSDLEQSDIRHARKVIYNRLNRQ